MAELNRFGFATMLTTDTTNEVGASGAALLNTHVNELANTLLVENLEWVDIQNLLFQVNGQEASDIVQKSSG